MFDALDLDQSGTISREEMRTIASLIDPTMEMSETSLDAMMAEADLSGNGEIDFEEFVSVLTRQLDASSAGALREGPLSGLLVQVG